MNTETSVDMSTFSTQADHQAGSGTKRKLLEEINSTRARNSKNEDCVGTENCGLSTTIEVLTSKGQTVPLATADLQWATTQEIDMNEACTLENENGGVEISLLDVDSILKQLSDSCTDSNADFSESISQTEHPVAEFQDKNDPGNFGEYDLSGRMNFLTDASSNAAEVEDGHKSGGGKEKEIASSGNNNSLIDRPDLKLAVRPERRRQLKGGEKKCKGMAKSHPGAKIRRPPNAFILFSNDWRKKMAIKHPGESNRQISVRLGGMWKEMEGVQKIEYFARARQAVAEHKKKYPDHVYNPKAVRRQKRLREQARGKKLRRLTTAQTTIARLITAQKHRRRGRFPRTQVVALSEIPEMDDIQFTSTL